MWMLSALALCSSGIALTLLVGDRVGIYFGCVRTAEFYLLVGKLVIGNESEFQYIGYIFCVCNFRFIVLLVSFVCCGIGKKIVLSVLARVCF